MERCHELEGLTVYEAEARVAGMVGVEGFVVSTESGDMVKIKSGWWHRERAHVYVRWEKGQRKKEADRLQKKKDLLQYQGCRAVLKGWPGDKSPGEVLGMVSTAIKVECFYARETGRRGAIVVSFKDSEECKRTVQKAAGVWKDNDLELKYAYSSRSSSNSWHRIRTWWRDC